MITKEQKKISFGGNIRDTGVLSEAVSRETFERLYRRAVEEFNGGSELNFGAIRVQPSRGITIRKWLSSRRILWREIAGFQVNEYLVSVDRVKNHFADRVPTDQVANVWVLQALLTSAIKHVW